mmetsp:Transcript_12815/g.20277  ORF Transcript_12815/g.20277 Transcript_12815/m.20277 type:complete len:220 (-) Transcript_12815:502-1161(-)
MELHFLSMFETMKSTLLRAACTCLAAGAAATFSASTAGAVASGGASAPAVEGGWSLPFSSAFLPASLLMAGVLPPGGASPAVRLPAVPLAAAGSAKRLTPPKGASPNFVRHLRSACSKSSAVYSRPPTLTARPPNFQSPSRHNQSNFRLADSQSLHFPHILSTIRATLPGVTLAQYSWHLAWAADRTSCVRTPLGRRDPTLCCKCRKRLSASIVEELFS